jgi:hypothetical protein
MPVLEGLKDCEEFLVMSVIVEFHRVKGVGIYRKTMYLSICMP